MVSVQTLAKELNINADQLMLESINLYLRNNLYKVESEMYIILQKFNVDDIYDFEKKVKSGVINESQGFDDFFKLDSLTAQKDKFKSLLALLND
ncbi:MAG: hypothetical protein HW421_2466 [Ignavibacteria bacterium]|nr:hypothetical protein [Ignavibacteria bacterium]